MHKYTRSAIIVMLAMVSLTLTGCPTLTREAGVDEQTEKKTLATATDAYTATMKVLTSMKAHGKLTKGQAEKVGKWRKKALVALRKWAIRLRQNRSPAEVRADFNEAFSKLKEMEAGNNDNGRSSSSTGIRHRHAAACEGCLP